VTPRAEIVHWLFASGILTLGLILLAEAIVGQEIWRRRRWRAYLWPSLAFLIGVLLWPVSVFYTNSTLHMVAHASWAEAAMIAGGAEIALVRGKLSSRWWALTVSGAMALSGLAFLIHEQNPWFFSRAAFLHHTLGWVLLIAAIFPIGQAIRPRAFVFNAGFALTWVTVAVLLYCDRDLAPIFGHLSPLAGVPK
jgi:hypothetical protein